MDGAGHQTRGQTVEIVAAVTEYDFPYGIVVRQHADDDAAVEQVADIRRGVETERLEFTKLIRAADIGDHPSSGGREVCGHRPSHVTKADKADFSQCRPAGNGRSRNARVLTGGNFRCTPKSEGRRFMLGHRDS